MTKTKPRKPGSGGETAGHREPSPLQTWLDVNGFTAAQLEQEINMSRQSLQQIREGRDCRLSTARRILGGCERLARHSMRMEEIFDLRPDHTDWIHRSSAPNP